MVAAAVIPTSLAGMSSLNSKRRSSMTVVTIASSIANWSPTHLRSPPPKGMKAKSVADSDGYRPRRSLGSYPAQPVTSGLLAGRSQRSGSNRLGLSHSCGDRPMLYIEIITSPARGILTPPSTPVPPSGHVSASSAHRSSRGGAGHMRSVSASRFWVSRSELISSMVGTRSPTISSISACTLASSSGCWLSAKTDQVSTAAVVSCPAINSVIKSSRICLLSTSSPRKSTRKRSSDGSLTFA
mmetsp:Transcript_7095/g.23314  ORF Transcript_7095/g.23314 Transcript_7095/m.23314 type:complete len:241 (-) Transcript_7095:1161-1883(-)